MWLYFIHYIGFPIAVSDVSASGGSSVNSVNAGAAVKKAAQSVETQAQLLTTQLSNKVCILAQHCMCWIKCAFASLMCWIDQECCCI